MSSKGQQTLRQRATSYLAEAGTWCSRKDLQARHQCSPVALDDTLSDLVIEGVVDYRENVGYRLAGTVLVRRALQIAMRERQQYPNQRRFMTPNETREDKVCFGFAQMEVIEGEDTLIAYEVEFDKARIDGESINDQVTNLIAIADKFFTGGTSNAGTSL